VKLSTLREAMWIWLKYEQGWQHPPSSQKVSDAFQRKGFTIEKPHNLTHVADIIWDGRGSNLPDSTPLPF
jgi:hypothetical protein